jgi:hypothetical protein
MAKIMNFTPSYQACTVSSKDKIRCSKVRVKPVKTPANEPQSNAVYASAEPIISWRLSPSHVLYSHAIVDRINIKIGMNALKALALDA